MLANEMGGLIQAPERVLQLTLAHGSGSHDECAILNGVRDGLELLGLGKQWSRANGGTRLAKCQFVGVHHAEVEETKVAHGACGGADIERVARRDENNAQVVGFGFRGQDGRVYSRKEAKEAGSGLWGTWKRRSRSRLTRGTACVGREG